jgi:hypothetical protein
MVLLRLHGHACILLSCQVKWCSMFFCYLVLLSCVLTCVIACAVCLLMLPAGQVAPAVGGGRVH